MGIAVNSEKRVERFANQLSKGLVFFGGAVLTALALMTVLSTIGRAFVGLQIGLGPIPGDFELVEVGTAVSVFCFMAWCQLNQGHVTVDIFTNQFVQRATALLILIGNSLIFIVAFVIAWRLWMGFGEQVTWFSQPIRDLIGFGYKPFTNNTTYILGMPFWYSYLLSFIGAFCFALISAFTVWRSLNDLLGRDK